jgi:hypothetical protein
MDGSPFRTSCVPTFYVLHPHSQVFLETPALAIYPSLADHEVETALSGVAAAPDVAEPVVDVAAVAVVGPAAVAFVVPASVSEAAELVVAVALVSVVDVA